jgi:hypothetical protein
MVSPPNNKSELFKEKGQRLIVLNCLLNGTENISSITKKLGYKTKKSPWISNYIKKLKNKGYVDESTILFKDKLGRSNRKPILKLNINYFIDYSKTKDITFSKLEKKWFKQQLEKQRLWTLVFSYHHCGGNIIKALLCTFAESVSKIKEISKKIRLVKKLLILIYNQRYSPRLYGFGQQLWEENNEQIKWPFEEEFNQKVNFRIQDLNTREDKIKKIFEKLIR